MQREAASVRKRNCRQSSIAGVDYRWRSGLLKEASSSAVTGALPWSQVDRHAAAWFPTKRWVSTYEACARLACGAETKRTGLADDNSTRVTKLAAGIIDQPRLPARPLSSGRPAEADLVVGDKCMDVPRGDVLLACYSSRK